MGSKFSLAAMIVRNGGDPFAIEQEDWVNGTTSTWPERWKRDALARYQQIIAAQGVFIANQWLQDMANEIAACKIAPNASDADLLQLSETQAKRATERASRWSPFGLHVVRRELDKLCNEWRIEPPGENTDAEGAVARMTDVLWWRRKLRKKQGRERESIAIALGRVHARRDIYLSPNFALTASRISFCS